jgi:hypothetical protein
LTGTPTAPTPATGDNSTKLATTAFVKAQGYSTTTGTVTSIGLSLPSSILTVSGSPVTSSGTLTGALATQTAHQVWAGPTSGAAAMPTFRLLVAADIPDLSATYLTGNQTITLSGDATGSGATSIAVTVDALQGNAVSTASPSNGQVLTWVSSTSKWTPQTPSGGVASPGGSTGDIQWNNGGSFAGGGPTWNGSQVIAPNFYSPDNPGVYGTGGRLALAPRATASIWFDSGYPSNTPSLISLANPGSSYDGFQFSSANGNVGTLSRWFSAGQHSVVNATVADPSQIADLEQWQDSSANPLSRIYASGAIGPAHLADSAAPNDSIYYSTTASKLVYKDSSGTVNALY